MVRQLSIVVWLLVGVVLLAAQERPAFDIASIKERQFVSGSVVGVEFQPGGRVIATMAPVPLLITFAYELLPSQLEIAPGVRNDAALMTFYDIDARPEAGAIPPGRLTRESRDKVRAMMRALLADRLKLRMHTEKRDLPIFSLVVDKGGLKLQRAPARDCELRPSPCRWVTVGPASGAVGQSVTLEGLADQLSPFQGRSIVNKTDVEGVFDIRLPPFSRGATIPGTLADGVPVDGTAPSLETVLQEVGLRLEPGRQLLDVYVVDHVEKASPN